MNYRATTYSEDGTIKYILGVPIKLQNSSRRIETGVEAAFIHLPDRKDGKPEYVLCLSSQVGCFYDCRMCANAFSMFHRCLHPEELNEQIALVLGQDGNLEKIKKAGQVEYAFMAMGEPLFGASVVKAIQEHKRFVPDTRFSLSTVGAKGTIKRLANADLPYPVRLELSLHFSNDRLRNEWIRSDYIFRVKDPELNIEQMLREAEEYYQKHPGKVTLNYALIDGVNNMDENVSELLHLLRGQRKEIFYVKVMRPNLTSSLVYSARLLDTRLDATSIKTYNPRDFRDKLLENGIEATLFESKGTDIYAGCGMMVARYSGEQGTFFVRPIPEADASMIGF